MKSIKNNLIQSRDKRVIMKRALAMAVTMIAAMLVFNGPVYAAMTGTTPLTGIIPAKTGITVPTPSGSSFALILDPTASQPISHESTYSATVPFGGMGVIYNGASGNWWVQISSDHPKMTDGTNTLANAMMIAAKPTGGAYGVDKIVGPTGSGSILAGPSVPGSYTYDIMFKQKVEYYDPVSSGYATTVLFTLTTAL